MEEVDLGESLDYRDKVDLGKKVKGYFAFGSEPLCLLGLWTPQLEKTT